MNERDAFLVANEISDPNDRAADLDQACTGNAKLRARMSAMYGGRL